MSLDPQDIPGLPEAARAVREFIGADEVSYTAASMIATEAIKAATLPLLAAAFADVSDAAADEGLTEASLYLDAMSLTIRERTPRA